MGRGNRKAVLEDRSALAVLCANGGKDAPNEVRCRAYLALANLSVQLRGAEDTLVGKQLVSALTVGTDKKQPVDVRSRVFGALWSMAASAANLRGMWTNIDIRYALAAALS